MSIRPGGSPTIGLRARLAGRHAVASLVAGKPPRLLPPLVLAELDYLNATRLGHEAQLALIDEVTKGTYQLELFSTEDARQVQRIMVQYADLRIG